ncbi:MAG: sigma-70 family RNA polymerase sigma factor [Oscillospiraceae bacterium]|jgi:RNA polymerase sigma-70 factor (ECF subfamily)|nr:sigma-70 family RNA polymerase sigma factor [Oscillospiraceae bacterium]
MAIFYFSAIEGKKKQDEAVELYIKYKSFMYNIANSVLEDHGEAEDAVHNAFIRIIENFEKFDLRDGHKTKSLIGMIVKGYAIDAYRHRENMVAVEELPEEDGDNGTSLEGQLIDRERYEDLKRHLASLDALYADVILLKYDGYSNAEMASLLGVTEDVVRQRLHRARVKLKKRLEMEGDQDGAKKSQ